MRRGLAAAAGLAALFLAPPTVAEERAPAAFDPPSAPMILTRTIDRALNDGKTIHTEPAYEIRFVADKDGYRVDGRLLSVKVEVPPRLEALAAFERARGDAGLFPMHVDADGRLREQPDAAPDANVARALGVADGYLDKTGLSASDSHAARAFIAGLEKGAARKPLPADFFRPVTGTSRSEEPMALPDGRAGTLAVVVTAARDPATGLLRSLERQIVTRLPDSARVSRETWTLERDGTVAATRPR